jgi:hypothetical protein
MITSDVSSIDLKNEGKVSKGPAKKPGPFKGDRPTAS